MATTYNMPDHRRGDTWNGLTVQVFAGEDNTDPEMDLTGASIKMQVKTAPGSVARLSVDTTGSGIVITNASEGRFTVNAMVVDLVAGSYVYDLQLTLADGTVRTILSGSWEIVNDTTR